MEVNETYSGQKTTFYVDSESDISSLPNHASNDVGFYSTCVVAESANVYILTSEDEWIILGGE